ncbi:hypothetical protein AB3S75_043045 [Citrus x aurantiifolia]
MIDDKACVSLHFPPLNSHRHIISDLSTKVQSFSNFHALEVTRSVIRELAALISMQLLIFSELVRLSNWSFQQ